MSNSKLSELVKAVGTLAILLSAPNYALDQLDELFGVPDTSIPEYAQFSYLRGDWDVRMVTIDKSGEKVEIPHRAKITGFYHRGGKIFQSCFVTSKFYSTDIRAFDTEAKEWRAHFLSANAQRWSGFAVKKIGNTMQSIILKGYSGKEIFDVKSVVSDISEDSFQSKIYASYDKRESWIQTYELFYTRADSGDGFRISC